jgi:hypothetical protein
VVAIGIDSYQNWPHLATAVSDATGFAGQLHDHFGYELAVEPLTEQAATKHNIESLIDDDLRGKLKPDDDLVIFFAGHGTTRKDRVGDVVTSVGFLVPYDARAAGAEEHWSDYINVDEFLRIVGGLPARHILVILDSCHSGLALGNSFTATRDDERFREDMSRNVSRKVIASAQGDQTAADQGPKPNHSLFTGLMMQGLESGKADLFGQGFVTGSQLGAFAQHEVSATAGSRQTPLFGSFYQDAGGELVFPVNSDFKALYQQAVTALRSSDNKVFLQLSKRAVDLRPDAPESQWLRFRVDLLNGDGNLAKAELEKLADAYYSEKFSLDSIPLDVRDVGSLESRIAFWNSAFTLPVDASKLSVTLSGVSPEGATFESPVKQGGVHSLARGKPFELIVKNISDSPLSIGAISINAAGEVEAEEPDHSQNESSNEFGAGSAVSSDQMISPGGVVRFRLSQTGEPEASEFYLIASPRAESSLARPPAYNTRGLSRAVDLTGATQMNIYLKFSNQVEGLTPVP